MMLKLPFNYTLLRYYRVGNFAVAMVEVDDPNHTRYATYQVDVHDSSCFWGHYINDRSEAHHDFDERIAKEYNYEMDHSLPVPGRHVRVG